MKRRRRPDGPEATWGDQFDRRIADLAERTARRLTRRDALRTAFLGGAASFAAVALGQKPALTVRCHCGPTHRCTYYGHGCPSQPGCPSGYSLCENSTTNSCSCDQKNYNIQGYCCEYTSGTWIACSGLGNGYGYRVCSDCIGSVGCRYWCTCLSACVCCQCVTAADVRDEQARLGSAL